MKGKDKFTSRSKKCVFVGYPFGTKGWKVFDLKTKKKIICRDAIFYENLFPFKNLGTVDCHNKLVDDRREIEKVRPSYEGAEELGHASTEAQSKDRRRSARESSRQLGRGKDDMLSPRAEEPATHLGRKEETLPGPESVAVAQDHIVGGQWLMAHSRPNELEPTTDQEIQSSDRN